MNTNSKANKSAKKRLVAFISIITIALSMFSPAFLQEAFASERFKPEPQTTYANKFIENCESQQWFMEELEFLLNQQGKSLNTIESKEDFKNIYTLGLADKNIEGKIPKAIGELYNLEYLYLSQNNLSGTIPSELFNLTNLKNLDLSENNLSGQIPVEISNLGQLEVLLLHDNNLVGTIPSSITDIVTLENIDLSNNKLSGNIPSDFTGLTNLSFFSVAQNNLTGYLPQGLSSLPNLKVLLLSNNSITGNLDNLAGDTSSLELADLSNNAFVGDIDGDILNLINSGITVDLRGNYLSGDNIETVVKNDDNFIEEIEGQNRLLMPMEVRNTVGAKTNISGLLKSYDPMTMEIKREKLKLPLSEYTIGVVPESYLSKISWEAGGDGSINLIALGEISKDSPAHITMSITQNDGRPYSVVSFDFYTIKDGGGDANAGSGEYTMTPASEIGLEAATTPKGVPVNTSENPDPNKYISGYPDGSFRPDGNITREEFAQILYSIDKGSLQANVKPSIFTDVAEGRWSKEAIDYVNDNKLMIGYPDGSFKPEAYLTRAEFATAISHYKNLQSKDGGSFNDIEGHWAESFINSTYEEGYMSGYPDGSFKPDKNITRAETVSSINRVLGIKIDKAYIDENVVNPFSDLEKSHWAYYDILSAVR